MINIKKLIIIFMSFMLVFGFTVNGKSWRFNEDEIIYYGQRNSNKIYLTFDDGYSVSNTTKILEILKEKNIKVTFFIEGKFLREQSEMILKILEDGHLIGNHTWSHRDITKLSDKLFLEEIKLYEEKYQEITNTTITKIFRPPMGCINQKKFELLKELGYTIFMWDVTSIDYLRKKDLGVTYVYNEIVRNTLNGSLILMHTLTDSIPKALPLIIDTLIEKGYEFSTLNDFL